MRVIVLDQFSSIHPYALQQRPVRFADLLATLDYLEVTGHRTPQVLDVAEDYIPPYSTTVVREGVGGLTEVWKYRWDSSG